MNDVRDLRSCSGIERSKCWIGCWSLPFSAQRTHCTDHRYEGGTGEGTKKINKMYGRHRGSTHESSRTEGELRDAKTEASVGETKSLGVQSNAAWRSIEKLVKVSERLKYEAREPHPCRLSHPWSKSAFRSLTADGGSKPFTTTKPRRFRPRLRGKAATPSTHITGRIAEPAIYQPFDTEFFACDTSASVPTTGWKVGRQTRVCDRSTALSKRHLDTNPSSYGH